MSDFAYFRLVKSQLLTEEEEQHKDEMTSALNQVLDAKGLECDAKTAKMPEEEMIKILVEARRIRRKKKMKLLDDSTASVEGLGDEQHDKKEVVYAGTG